MSLKYERDGRTLYTLTDNPDTRRSKKEPEKINLFSFGVQGQCGVSTEKDALAEAERIQNLLNNGVVYEDGQIIIQISVKGGIISDITGIPKGAIVRVTDYDILGDGSVEDWEG